MNVQDARLEKPEADEDIDRLLMDRGALFLQRTAAVAAAAAAEADEVDRDARFPKAAIDAAREQKLLGMQIPVALGGFCASIAHVPENCYKLRRACAFSA